MTFHRDLSRQIYVLFAGMAFKTLRGRTKHTQVNVETGNDQSQQIRAFQGYPSINQHSFQIQTSDKRWHPAAVDWEGYYDHLFDHVLTNTESSLARWLPRKFQVRIGPSDPTKNDATDWSNVFQILGGSEPYKDFQPVY